MLVSLNSFDKFPKFRLDKMVLVVLHASGIFDLCSNFLRSVKRSFCKIRSFRENFIFEKSVKTQVSPKKISRLKHDLPTCISESPIPLDDDPLRTLHFSKSIPNRRRSVDSTATRFWDLTLPVRFYYVYQYASTTVPLRCRYDLNATIKIRLRLVVCADDDAAATLLLPR